VSQSPDSGPLVLLKIDDDVATVTINRPHRRNSLVPELLQQITDAFQTIEGQRRNVKVVVLQAAGESFSTGGDLGAFRQHRNDLESFANKIVCCLNDAIISIIECKVPVVVAVDGQVTGGSMGLVLACDIIIVTDRATFTPYYTEVGFGPDGGWTALLPAIVGQNRAAAVQLLNDTISAQQAVDWGIAYSLVISTGLQKLLDDVCSRIACKKEGSVQLTKRLMRTSDYREQLDRERQAFVKQVTTREAIDGVEDFVARYRKDT
jgi:2-(1,2-epoxy-1,2-dihydrophenyl)acetyl-CoA isomerase